MVELIPFGQRVTEDEFGNETVTEAGEEYYTVDPSAFTYILINAVQQQQALIEGLTGNLEKQNEAIRQLKQEVEELRVKH